jgi:hypothetical protein
MRVQKIKKIPNAEIVHYMEGDDCITSKSNRVFVRYKSHHLTIKLPVSFLDNVLGVFRLSRRALRLDKCNVFVSGSFLILIKKRKVYSYNLETAEMKETLTLLNCKNILHQSMGENKQGELFFGEYGGNSKRKPVNVYKSSNNGQSWEVIYQFKAGEIRHVHGCYYDTYEDKIWTLTGDFDGENIIMKSDANFKQNEKIGDRSQTYRAVSVFFSHKKVHWIMDSPLRKNYHYELDRQTYEIKQKQAFPGPVWYIKKLSDDYYLAASSVEIGEGVLDNYAKLFVSKNLNNWEEVAKFKKDILPMRYFKWGVIGLADGQQSKNEFALFFEALKGVDGKSYIYRLDDR